VLSDTLFYNKFDDLDQRKAGTYAKVLTNPATGLDFVFTLPRFRKYIDPLDLTNSVTKMDVDRTILRYADALLTKAEAINERDHAPNSEAYEAINAVRHRAFLNSNPTDHYIPSGLSYEDFRDAVREERFLEFTYEQQRWLDLVRWRVLVKTVKPIPGKDKIELKHYRFPIPQSQRNMNPDGLWQNWGYDGYDEAKTGAAPYAGFE
jgi:hypothetical protein